MSWFVFNCTIRFLVLISNLSRSVWTLTIWPILHKVGGRRSFFNMTKSFKFIFFRGFFTESICWKELLLFRNRFVKLLCGFKIVGSKRSGLSELVIKRLVEGVEENIEIELEYTIFGFLKFTYAEWTWTCDGKSGPVRIQPNTVFWASKDPKIFWCLPPKRIFCTNQHQVIYR